MQTAEFAVAQGIYHKSAFNLCTRLVLKKRDKIIASIKFGIKLPKTVYQAYALNVKNGNTLWMEAIYKEMENVRLAFELLSSGKSVPIGHQFMQCHMVLDIKLEDFRQKARLVAGGHMMETLATITYASAVSREIVRIALMKYLGKVG